MSINGPFIFDSFCLLCQVHPGKFVTSNFLLLQLPLHSMVPWSLSGRIHGVTVQSGLLRNRGVTDQPILLRNALGLDRLAWDHYWWRTRVSNWMVAHLDRSAPSSFAPFLLYKSNSSPFISLIFYWNIQSKRICHHCQIIQFNCYIRHPHLTSEDYEDLSNHATEAMGASGLFSVAQVRHVCPYPFCSIHLPPSLTIFFSSNGDDEGTNGTVLEPWNSDGSC